MKLELITAHLINDHYLYTNARPNVKAIFLEKMLGKIY